MNFCELQNVSHELYDVMKRLLFFFGSLRYSELDFKLLNEKRYRRTAATVLSTFVKYKLNIFLKISSISDF